MSAVDIILAAMGHQRPASTTVGAADSNIAYTNGVYLTLGDSLTAYTSSDAVTWNSSSIPTFFGIEDWGTYATLAGGGGTFVTFTSQLGLSESYTPYMYSSNGQSWTSSSFNISTSQPWVVSYANATFFVFSEYYTYTSSNGSEWTSLGTDVLGENEYGSTNVVYGNDLYVTLINGSATSSNGSGWTPHVGALPFTSLTFPSQALAFGNDTFVAIALNSDIAATSTDGVHWTGQTLPATTSTTACSIAFGNGYFVIVLGTPTALISSDGVNWTEYSLPSGSWRHVIYSTGNTFVACSSSGQTAFIFP